MKNHSLCRALFCALSLLFFFRSGIAAEPQLTLHLPFDDTIQPKVAGSSGQARYGLKEAPQFAEGIHGQGLLTGGTRQQVTLAAQGNIAPDEWTISCWVKGLPGAKWNGPAAQKQNTLQMFWGLHGDQGEILWFYRFQGKPSPWLLYRPKKGEGNPVYLYVPQVPEEEWHYWVVTWRKGAGAYLYLDGQAVGQTPCLSPQPVTSISIGQAGNEAQQNKVIDEFKIYDGALTPGQIARQYWREGNFALSPTVTVAPTQNKITLDGKLEPEEWQGAAGFSGLIEQEQWNIAEPATRGWLTYDKNNLYLAMHSDTPAEARSKPDTTVQHGFVRRDAVQAGPEVKNDDHFFWHITPPGKNEFAFYANGIDTTYGLSKAGVDATPVPWPARAQVKSQIGMDGWTMEAALPLASLGIDAITDQTTWRMNAGRLWRMLRQRTDLWVNDSSLANDAWNNGTRGATLHFAAHSVVTNLQKLSVDAAGRIAVEATLFNSDRNAHTVQATLLAAGKVIQQQEIALQPAQRQALSLNVLPRDANGGLIEFKVQQGDALLFSQACPLIIEQVGRLQFWSYPSQGQLRLGWELPSASENPEHRLHAVLKDGTGKAVLQHDWEGLPGMAGNILWDIKNLADGRYTLELQMSRGADILQQQAFSYEKKPLPAWLGNLLGLGDTPPPPWTDIALDKNNDSLSIWGRRYEFDGLLLPRQIINRDQPMLAAPMRFVVKTADNTNHSSAAARASKAQWTRTTAARTDFARNQTVGDVQLQTQSYLEFDGMVWTQLTVVPNRQTAALGGLSIEIPLKAEWAELIRPFNDYRLQQTGRLPEGGWKGKATEMPWLGNGNGGIQFFQENTAHWVGSKSIEVVRSDAQTATLRINLIDSQVTLDKPLQFSFGWIVSPVKPAPRGHRDWRLINQGTLSAKGPEADALSRYIKTAASTNPKIKWTLPWWQGWWWLPEPATGNVDHGGIVPLPVGNGRENAVTLHEGVRLYGAPYGRLTELGTANEWFEQFGDEWVPNVNKPLPDESLPKWQQATTVSQASQSLNDFFAWGYNRLLNEGQVQALYFDVSRIISDGNIYRGAGIRLPDGSIEPSFNILGMRQAFRRIYTLLHAKHPDARLLYHMSGDIMLPVYSFSDGLVDGENFTGMLDRKENRGYDKILTLDQFRTEFSTQNNFGPASVFLPEFERAKSILPEEWEKLGYSHAEYLLGQVLLHDSAIWWAYMPQQFLANVYQALDATGLNSEWEFIPYWSQKTIPLPEGVHASLYQSPDKQKTVVVLMNTQDEDQKVQLPLQLEKEIYHSAKAIYPNEAIDIRNVPVKRNNFRVILLQK